MRQLLRGAGVKNSAFYFQSCVYFIRNISGVIPVPNDIDEANATLSLHVETGVINDGPLAMLEQMIAQVLHIMFKLKKT